jgi:uncharacterized zinc-type alcohol dehydrogenase-like protein
MVSGARPVSEDIHFEEPIMQSHTLPTRGYAAMAKGSPLEPWNFERRALRAHDVAIRVYYCGVCHSDLHSTAGQWAEHFPVVPGHEIMGEVLEVGAAVKAFAKGDQVLIGTIVDSCRECAPCLSEQEPYCRAYPTTTYNGFDRIDGSRTFGGYSEHYVADERFVYHLPEGLDPAAAAPLLCAGVTTWSPLRHWGVGPGKTVGVVGIGGLGHLGIKFARALGAHVVAFTTSPGKLADALALGAHEAVLSTDEAQMKAMAYRIDFMLDTVSQSYPLDPILATLNLNGTICSLGIPDRLDFTPVQLTLGRRSLTSSGVGGTRDTREMLAFCAEHQLLPDVELIKPEQINEAFERLKKNDVRYRFVLDLRQA